MKKARNDRLVPTLFSISVVMNRVYELKINQCCNDSSPDLLGLESESSLVDSDST